MPNPVDFAAGLVVVIGVVVVVVLALLVGLAIARGGKWVRVRVPWFRRGGTP